MKDFRVNARWSDNLLNIKQSLAIALIADKDVFFLEKLFLVAMNTKIFL